MKIYFSALPLVIGVILQFGVSSSMPSSPPEQPTMRRPNGRMYIPRYQDVPVFDKRTGELVAISYNQRRINICDLVFEERDPDLIPDVWRLWRAGPPGLHGYYHQHKIYYDYDLHYTGVTIQPQRNDFVVDPTGLTIKGIYRDDGRYFEIVHRKTHAHKWTLP